MIPASALWETFQGQRIFTGKKKSLDVQDFLKIREKLKEGKYLGNILIFPVSCIPCVKKFCFSLIFPVTGVSWVKFWVIPTENSGNIHGETWIVSCLWKNPFFLGFSWGWRHQK